MNLVSCVVLDLQSYELSQEERELLRHPVVAGVVLFTRNYADKRQLKALTRAILRQQPQAIIAVDQEGGRVQRFREGFTNMPAMSSWGEKYLHDPITTKQELAQAIHLLSTELQQIGVNLNLIPVLDIDHGLSDIIGGRSLHQDPTVIIELASVIIQSLHSCNMPAVGKHFPGHGGVRADSHQTLPIDSRNWAELAQADLKPFQALSPQLDIIMPAHIVFSQCDQHPVTYSRYWLQQILLQQLNFTGIIMSDDLTMAGAAIIGDYPERAQQALSAGVDLLLVCNERKGAIAILESLERYTFHATQQQRLYQAKQRHGWSE